jgi:hypothetical protein
LWAATRIAADLVFLADCGIFPRWRAYLAIVSV